MTYLITCSGSKQNPTIHNPSKLENLSFNTELLEARKKIILLNKIELEWDKTVPAWQLYSGKLYSQVSENNWLKPNADIFILSALFGWIKHTDLIPYYDLKMDKHFEQNIYVYSIWNHFNILPQFISNTDIDLLSTKYRKAINLKGNFVAQTPNVKWSDKWGSHKGKWLNEQLNKL